MFIRDMKLEYETHKVVAYKEDGNTTTIKNIPMAHLKSDLYIGKFTNYYDSLYADLYLYSNMYQLGVVLRNINVSDTDLNALPDIKADAFVQLVCENADKGAFVRDCNILFMRTVGKEQDASFCEQKKKQFLAKVKAEREAEEHERLQKLQMEVNEINKNTTAQINHAIETMKHGGKLQNGEIVCAQIVDGYLDSKQRNIINYLADKYNVKIPLRTKGWISEKLASVSISPDGSVKEYYFQRGSKSSSFVDWMNRLIAAVARADAEQVI